VMLDVYITCVSVSVIRYGVSIAGSNAGCLHRYTGDLGDSAVNPDRQQGAQHPPVIAGKTEGHEAPCRRQRIVPSDQ
nr:hypothetical protein [Dehalococcoidales bacterium]